jgi:hypothetical protein
LLLEYGIVKQLEGFRRASSAHCLYRSISGPEAIQPKPAKRDQGKKTKDFQGFAGSA